MMITRYFEVQFDDPNINRQQLRKFTEDHLKRMAQNNDKNLYDMLLTDTKAAYEKYFGFLNDTDTNNALQQSRTKSMENIRAQFSALLGRREGLITNSFLEDSPEYQEFFPHGLTEYSNASLENIETLMNRIITAAAAHADELGANLSLEFSKIKDSFMAARGQQLAQKGAASKASEDTDEAKAELQVQLTRNLLTIALNNIGNPGAAAMYFDQSIVARASSGGDDENTGLGDPQPEPVK